jgi:hypothetical protein
MRHCFFHGGGGQEPPASSDGDKAESFGQVFPTDAAGAPRPGFPGHGKTEREMSKSWSKSPAMNMTPIFATKHWNIPPSDLVYIIRLKEREDLVNRSFADLWESQKEGFERGLLDGGNHSLESVRRSQSCPLRITENL